MGEVRLPGQRLSRSSRKRRGKHMSSRSLLLLTACVALLASAAAAVWKVLRREKIRSEIDYFSQNALR